MSQNNWVETVLGTYVEVIEPGIEDHWKLVLLSARDQFYGKKFELKKTNPSGTQGWVAGQFTKESLTGLRDMLTAVLDEL